MSRVCARCKQEKPLTEYYSDGNRTYCKTCDSTLARWRMGSPENKIRTAYRDAKKAAAKHGVYDDLTLDDVMYTFAIAAGHCNYCGKLAGNDLQLEHIFSLSSGGHNTIANITCACSSCNRRKNDEAILTHIQTTSFDDIDLINALIDRIAYRMGVSRSDVAELLYQQQSDKNEQRTRELLEKIKRKGSRNDD